MHVEVDQSGKIGDTGVPTVLAFSNRISFSILIPPAVKRESLRKLRARGRRGKSLYLQLFAVALYLLLKEHITKLSLISIDVEYPGHNRAVKEHLLNLLRRDGLNVPAEAIEFRYIGKKSPAHRLALETFRGKREPDRVISVGELLGPFKIKPVGDPT